MFTSLASLGRQQPEIYKLDLQYGDRSRNATPSDLLISSNMKFTVGDSIETVMFRVGTSQRQSLARLPPLEVLRVGLTLQPVAAEEQESTSTPRAPPDQMDAAPTAGSPVLHPTSDGSPKAAGGSQGSSRTSSQDEARPAAGMAPPASPSPRSRQFVSSKMAAQMSGPATGGPPPATLLPPVPEPDHELEELLRGGSLGSGEGTLVGRAGEDEATAAWLKKRRMSGSSLGGHNRNSSAIGRDVPEGEGETGSSLSPSSAMHRSRSLPMLLRAEDEQEVRVELRLWVELREAALVEVDLARDPSSGVAPSTAPAASRATVGAALGALDLDYVRRLRVGESVPDVWVDSRMVPRWRSLQSVDLNGAQLAEIPRSLVQVQSLTSLALSNNRLTSLPAGLGGLSKLRRLVADNNLISQVPLELRECSELESLSLEFNKLVMPLLDFRKMPGLISLRLDGNPLEYLPELSPCQRLRHLTLAGVSITGSPADSGSGGSSGSSSSGGGALLVEVATTEKKGAGASESYLTSLGGGSRGANKLGAFFHLIFRRSGCQHPLLAASIARITEDRASCDLIAKEEGAIQQLILMMLSDNLNVVQASCRALAALAQDPGVALKLVEGDGLQSMMALLRSPYSGGQKCALRVLANLAFASEGVAELLLTEEVQRRLRDLCATPEAEVQHLALEAVGTLAFSQRNARRILEVDGMRGMLTRLAGSGAGGGAGAPAVRASAIRALAVLGENEEVRRAVGRPPVHGRGLRILSMDGGGMRGLSTVRMLRRIEQGTGRRIHELFDVICGTSTGGILAVALGIRQLTLDACVDIYKELGRVVFSKPAVREDASWRDSLYSMYKSQAQNLRVVVQGCKHDAASFEHMVRNMCEVEGVDVPMIDTAVRGGPKTFVVATQTSVMPARPFLFRNYEMPPLERPESACHGKTVGGGTIGGYDPTGVEQRPGGPHRQHGTSKHYVWQAIRASSAAPYYLADYAFGGDRWQDGAVVANNPTVLAVEECRHLWPDRPIDCIVSVGAGCIPESARGSKSSISSFLDLGTVLVEGACNVERVDEALATLGPLVPGLSYFRFTPIHDTCAMELDDIDPDAWRRLEAATDEYVGRVGNSFDACCEILAEKAPIPAPEGSAAPVTPRAGGRESSGARRVVEAETSLGYRRGLLLLEAAREPAAVRGGGAVGGCDHADAVQRVVEELGGVCSRVDVAARQQQREGGGGGRGEGGSRDGGVTFHEGDSPPPLGRRDGGGGVGGGGSQVQELLRGGTSQAGVVHLALRADDAGAVLRWERDVSAVAVPSAQADELLASANEGLLAALAADALSSGGGGGGRGGAAAGAHGSLEDLCLAHPRFEALGLLHVFLGRHVQVVGGRRVGAFLFERVLPSEHLTAGAARLMAAGWRDKIVVCAYAVPGALVAAVLDSGARAVVAPRHSYAGAAAAAASAHAVRTPQGTPGGAKDAGGMASKNGTPSKWGGGGNWGALSPRQQNTRSPRADQLGDGGNIPLARPNLSFTYGSSNVQPLAPHVEQAEPAPPAAQGAGATAPGGGVKGGGEDAGPPSSSTGIASFFSALWTKPEAHGGAGPPPAPGAGAAAAAAAAAQGPGGAGGEKASSSSLLSTPPVTPRTATLTRSSTMPLSPSREYPSHDPTRSRYYDGEVPSSPGRWCGPSSRRPPSPAEESLAAFFSAFYWSILSGGGGATSALGAAEAEAPELEGHFCIMHFAEGELTASGH